MGSGHRRGHPRRGREGDSSPPSGERILVLPGEEIPEPSLRPGPGTYRVNGKIYASVLGLLQRKPPLVRVVPLSGRYIPKAEDVVVGTVTDVQGTFWLLDIGAPRWAPLHMTGTPWKIDFGETEQYLHVADSVVVAVESIENTGRIGVTMNGEGLGKLEGGTIVSISPAKVPRVIGRSGSMINTITKMTETKVVVGQNGRVWLDGPAEGLVRARECLRMIEEEGQRSGLTERIQQYLESTGSPRSGRGGEDSDPEEAPGRPHRPSGTDHPSRPASPSSDDPEPTRRNAPDTGDFTDL
ncbi:MAG: exosome complex RNA-binding protein Rrp4 [Thermoplasmata archaeon]|nr:exosome complex RNA-binding protein Rrp4 [Thermoplasmata archaeon]